MLKTASYLRCLIARVDRRRRPMCRSEISQRDKAASEPMGSPAETPRAQLLFFACKHVLLCAQPTNKLIRGRKAVCSSHLLGGLGIAGVDSLQQVLVISQKPAVVERQRQCSWRAGS